MLVFSWRLSAPVCARSARRLPPTEPKIRPDPDSLSRSAIFLSGGTFWMSSPRYYPQKETLSWAKGNTFFMQKTSMHQREKFLGKMFPFSNKMFPRILASAKRLSFRRSSRGRSDSVLSLESTLSALVPRHISGDGGRCARGAPETGWSSENRSFRSSAGLRGRCSGRIARCRRWRAGAAGRRNAVGRAKSGVAGLNCDPPIVTAGVETLFLSGQWARTHASY